MKKIEVCLRMTLADDDDSDSLPKVNGCVSETIVMFVDNSFVMGYYNGVDNVFFNNLGGVVKNMNHKQYCHETSRNKQIEPLVYWCYPSDHLYMDTIEE